MTLISERDFATEMQTVVEPALNRLCVKGKFGDGLYYETYFPDSMKGVVLISHGFTEASLKFHEAIYYFLGAGYGVAVTDHRGHGYSPRLVDNPNIVHIDKFERYVDDFETFATEIVKPAVGDLPLYIYGHSMGGCIAALLVERGTVDFRKAVLNAPMLGILIGSMPAWVAVAACRIMNCFGQGKKKLYFHGDFNPDARFEDDVATSRARFDYYQAIRRKTPQLQTSAASYNWAKESVLAGKRAVKAAGTVKIPVLLFQSAHDTLVDGEAQQKFVKAAPNAELVRVENSKHEIYRSENAVLEGYWEKIFAFLDN